MSAESAPERRRGERRRSEELRLWRALEGERRVAERRRGVPESLAVDDDGPAAPTEAPVPSGHDRLYEASASASRERAVGAPLPPGRARADDTPAPPVGDRSNDVPAPVDRGHPNDAPAPVDRDRSDDAPASTDRKGEPVRRPPVGDTPAAGDADARPDGSPRATAKAPPSTGSPETAPPVPPVEHSTVDPEVDPDAARRAALRQMLRAAEARQNRSGRARRPVLGPGARVRVLRGELAGRLATVADADYIHARVLLEPDGDARSCWVPFGRVGAVE